jgi:hypothetical protein
MLLEDTGEMLGVFKAQEVRGLADGFPVVQVSSGFLHHEVADNGSGRLACELTDEVAKIVG